MVKKKKKRKWWKNGVEESLSNWRDYTCFRPGCVKGHASWDKGRRTTGASINFNFEQTRKEANPGCIFDTPQHGVKPRGGRYPVGAADKWPARLDLLRIRASNHGRPVHRLSYSFSSGFSRGNRLSGTVDTDRSIPHRLTTILFNPLFFPLLSPTGGDFFLFSFRARNWKIFSYRVEETVK